MKTTSVTINLSQFVFQYFFYLSWIFFSKLPKIVIKVLKFELSKLGRRSNFLYCQHHRTLKKHIETPFQCSTIWAFQYQLRYNLSVKMIIEVLLREHPVRRRNWISRYFSLFPCKHQVLLIIIRIINGIKSNFHLRCKKHQFGIVQF